MADNGSFQINDIVLAIPPEQITVNRKSFNNFWSTLRTRSSIKSKSGFSAIDIEISAYFSDDPIQGELGGARNGYSQLRDLISQLRVTPFCYVENQYLRNSVLSGENTTTMVLALRQMDIQKVNESDNVNVIKVNFLFSWFNYFPFTPEWTYKKSIFGLEEVRDPRDSDAWKLLYKAEQKRAFKSRQHNYKEIIKLDNSNLVARFNQFALYTKKQLRDMREEFESLTDLREKLLQLSPDSDVSGNINPRLKSILSKSLGQAKSEILIRDMFGDTTSMSQKGSDKAALDEILNILENRIGVGTSSKYQIFTTEDEWRVVKLADGEEPLIQGNFSARLEDQVPEVSDSVMLLLERKRAFDFNSLGLIVTGISVSFNNVLATLPISGHTYPTYQHIGSIDAVVTIAVESTSESSIQALSQIYSTVENQAHTYRQIPAGHRNLIVENNLINLCGVHELLPENLKTETIPGNPGAHSAIVTFVDNPLTETTAEKISAGQSFSSSQSLRKAVAEILEENLAVIPDAIVNGSLKNINVESSSFVKEGFRRQSDKFLKYNPQYETNSDSKRAKLTSYYVYRGGSKNDNLAFGKVVQEYGDHLGALFKKLAKLLGISDGFLSDLVRSIFSDPTKRALFTITDDTVISVEKVLRDLKSFLLKTKDNRIILHADAILGDAPEYRYKYGEEGDEKEVADGEDLNETIVKIVNTTFMDWIQFANEFIDEKILNNPSVLELPQFETVREKMTNLALQNSVDCYPDFPMREVISLLEESTSNEAAVALNNFTKILEDKKFALFNLGISSLLNPDFYLYNRQRDSLGKIIDSSAINAAGEAIKKSRAEMRVAEADWFLGISKESKGPAYDKDIIGINKANLIYQHHVGINSAHEKKEDKDSKKSEKNNQRRAYREKVQYSGVGAPELQGEVLPSIKAGESIGGDALISIDPSVDPGNILMSPITSTTTLRSNKYAAECRHRFDTEAVLSPLPESAYTDQPLSSIIEENTEPDWQYPTPPDAQIITTAFPKWRGTLKDNSGSQVSAAKYHLGVDFAYAISGSKAAFLTPIMAAADGVIDFISYSPSEDSPGKKSNKGLVFIKLRHRGGYFSQYLHLQWDKKVELLSNLYWRKSESIDQESSLSPNKKILIRRGEQIGLMGSTGPSTGPHLHFEIFKYGNHGGVDLSSGTPGPETDAVYNPRRKRTYFNPISKCKGQAPITSSTPLVGINPQDDSILSKSVEQFEKDLHLTEGFSMARAYPTFKLYFIESDLGERRLFGWDDFFSYSSVKRIRYISSRKIAADLVQLELTNISGVLSNRKFGHAIDPTAPKTDKGEDSKDPVDGISRSNTLEENPIASLMLQEGVEIELRLGYSNNPEQLETVFNGRITDVQFTDNDDLVLVTCQSFATELVQTIQGDVKEFGGGLGVFNGIAKTGVIMEKLLAFPEVKHFGRWEGGIIGATTGEVRSLLTNRFTLIPQPQDDNVFAPQGTEGSFLDYFTFNSPYLMYNTTIWDTMQEMTLRHPSYIACPVPYRDPKSGSRMTLFFGVPDQLYFARGTTYEEDNLVNKLKEAADGFFGDDNEKSKDTITKEKSNISNGDVRNAKAKTGSSKLNKEQEKWFKSAATRFAQNEGFIKPFRSYHVATSSMHILSNSISTSAHNVFNTVTVQYSDNDPEINEKTASVEFGNLKTFTLKADAGILDEEVREALAQFPNCIGYEQAKNYAISLLFQSLKDAYRGTLTLMGNPKIKKYDIVYIFDEYNDMVGPIEVEQVVHEFSQEGGFITEVTPDLVVHVNQESTLSTSDAMGLIAEHGLKKIGMPSLQNGAGDFASTALLTLAGAAAGPVGLAASVVYNPITSRLFFNSADSATGASAPQTILGAAGLFIFRKLITRTQLAHPFRFSPLVHQGKPMIGGLPNRRTHGIFFEGIGKWFKDTSESLPLAFDDWYDRIQPNNWLYRPQGDYLEGFLKK